MTTVAAAATRAAVGTVAQQIRQTSATQPGPERGGFFGGRSARKEGGDRPCGASGRRAGVRELVEGTAAGRNQTGPDERVEQDPHIGRCSRPEQITRPDGEKRQHGDARFCQFEVIREAAANRGNGCDIGRVAMRVQHFSIGSQRRLHHGAIPRNRAPTAASRAAYSGGSCHSVFVESGLVTGVPVGLPSRRAMHQSGRQ